MTWVSVAGLGGGVMRQGNLRETCGRILLVIDDFVVTLLTNTHFIPLKHENLFILNLMNRQTAATAFRVF